MSELRKAREAAGLTTTELAARAGVSDGAIRGYEAGRNLPSVVTAQRIADALGVDVADIWKGEK